MDDHGHEGSTHDERRERVRVVRSVHRVRRQGE